MTKDQLDLLLKTARESLNAAVEGRTPTFCQTAMTHIPFGGIFVTLRQQHKLRGCMGTFAPELDMVRTVQEVARLAASDPRFMLQPILPVDLPLVNIEISILSPLIKADDPLELELGKHGILIDHPKGRGCFLPSVSVDCNWTREEFLSRCCRDKAGLPENSWRDPQTRVYLFTTMSVRE